MVVASQSRMVIVAERREIRMTALGFPSIHECVTFFG